MYVTLRGGLCCLAILAIVRAASFAVDASSPSSPVEKAVPYTDPKTTFQTYLEAVRKIDAKAAKMCWVIDDDNQCGALDVLVGGWISPRQLNQVAVKRFGEEGRRAIPQDWLMY